MTGHSDIANALRGIKPPDPFNGNQTKWEDWRFKFCTFMNTNDHWYAEAMRTAENFNPVNGGITDTVLTTDHAGNDTLGEEVKKRRLEMSAELQ